MTDRKRLEWFEIEDADYDFDFFDEKEVISEMLNNQAPKSVENFDSKGTQWDLCGDIDDYFDLLGGYDQDKMHLWSSDTESSNTVIVACFHYLHKKLYAFEVDKKQFIECFKNALNDITDFGNIRNRNNAWI